MSEELFSPPIVFIASVITEVLLHFYFPVMKILPNGIRDLGWLLVVLGLLLALWQFLTMVKRTPIPYGSTPKTLIVSGTFKFTRNAFYVSIMLISFGMAVYLTDLSPFIIVAIEFFIFDKFLIPPEEKVLEKTFGQSYKNYKQKVRRWI